MSLQPDFGAFVISLDFELHWGVRDHHAADAAYRENLLGEQAAIPAMLKVFEEFEIAATWATVGFLFAQTKTELESYRPALLPAYQNRSLSPYEETIGVSEKEDPLHFAPSLIRLIQKTPRQEIGTHTFSHYYCLEPGQDKEAFSADLESAIRISSAYQARPTSIVFPRNQHNPEYDDVLKSLGITCYRGNPRSWMYQMRAENRKNPLFRAARLADAYLNLAGHHTFDWREVWQDGLANVPASLFLRPFSRKLARLEGLRLKRIERSIEYAAQRKRIFHLWWHPHNFGVNLEANLGNLRWILDAVARYRDKYALRSLTMSEVAAEAKRFS